MSEARWVMQIRRLLRTHDHIIIVSSNAPAGIGWTGTWAAWEMAFSSDFSCSAICAEIVGGAVITLELRAEAIAYFVIERRAVKWRWTKEENGTF